MHPLIEGLSSGAGGWLRDEGCDCQKRFFLTAGVPLDGVRPQQPALGAVPGHFFGEDH